MVFFRAHLALHGFVKKNWLYFIYMLKKAHLFIQDIIYNLCIRGVHDSAEFFLANMMKNWKYQPIKRVKRHLPNIFK